MKRPLSVTLISFVFMLAGITGIIYHATELKNLLADLNVAWILVVRLVAVAGGWFVFRGRAWARWLLLTWIVYHIFISFYHSISQVAIHILFTALTLIALFNTRSNAYFQRR